MPIIKKEEEEEEEEDVVSFTSENHCQSHKGKASTRDSATVEHLAQFRFQNMAEGECFLRIDLT